MVPIPWRGVYQDATDSQSPPLLVAEGFGRVDERRPARGHEGGQQRDGEQ
jgi:hypothetical protein